MNLIERLRKGIVTSAPYEPQYTVPPVKICLEAADEIERLTAEEKMQLEQIVNQGLEIERLTAHDQFLADANKQWMADCERLTAELTTSRYWREQEVKDLTAYRDALSVAAALWNKRYIDACQQHADRQTNLGHQIVALEAERDAIHELMSCYNLGGWTDALALIKERDALKAALQLIKANTNTADWPDDINAAIQGAGK